MRIQELNLAAFGPFTDRTLNFGHEEVGLQVIYGPNEAGKSSALRGLKSLLHGIEERTLDNFLHPNDKLRIGGRLWNADGHELAFVRRKGRKNTLLTLDGEPLDDQALAPFLQGVTSDLFKTLFGIDHQALVQGGQEILEQKGEVGQALFSAALGSHTLHAVLSQLDDEADGLFRPRGSTRTINSSLKSYSDLNKAIRDSSLSSRHWDEHRRALERTTRELKQIQDDLAANRVEVNRVKRIQRVLPKFARRRELLRELELIDDSAILSDDFAERRQQAVKMLETAQVIVAKATLRLHGLQKQLEGLSVNQSLLNQAEIIEDLHARSGGHRKALQDRPHIEVERQQLLTDAELLLKQVRPDLDLTDISELRPVLARRQGIAELGNNNAVLLSRAKQTESVRAETETRLKSKHKERLEFPDSGSSAGLRRAITSSRRQGDMDTAIQSARSDLVTLHTRCTAELSRLSLWDGVLEDIPGLGFPGGESIDRYEEVYAELKKRFQRFRERQEEAAGVLQEVSLRLDEIQRAGAVPTETDLAEARSARDQVWKLLRRQWVDGVDISAQAVGPDPEASLADVFEHRVTDADELSDRLRREAGRVQAMAIQQARRESVQQQITDIARQLEACAEEKNGIDNEWRKLWATCGIQPRTPPEMRSWLNDLGKLRERVEQMNLCRQKIGELEQSRKNHVSLLDQQLEVVGKESAKFETLEAVLLECEGFAQQLDETNRQRGMLDKEIRGLEVDLEAVTAEQHQAADELNGWKTQWRELMQSLGLQGDVLPFEVTGFIEVIRELFAKLAEAEKLQLRIKAIDDDARSFSNQVANMVENVASEFPDSPVADAVVHIYASLSENRSRQTQRQQVGEQLELAKQEIQDSNITIQTMTDRLDSLCVEAGCGKHSELEAAERKSDRRLAVDASINTVEQEILETGEGASIAELEIEAGEVDPDLQPGRIEELRKKIDDELEPKRTELAETRGREEKELEFMDGGDTAAALADQAQTLLACIRSDAERYVRVKLAGRVLRDEIERYRSQNQGPLVRRASAHYAVLTRNSFQQLRTDFNEKDEPVLAGIRPDGEQVYVEGMSNGTRDQLYLALRLASLEKYMETSEPMPFIVDDILVDFDDERSEAALKVLADLAAKTQVILFTHHSKLVEQARQTDQNTTVFEL